MRQSETSSNAVQGTRTTSLYNLTKAQLIELLQGPVAKPLSPDDLYRCATAIARRWCDDVIKGRFASICSLTSKLETLEKIYHNR